MRERVRDLAKQNYTLVEMCSVCDVVSKASQIVAETCLLPALLWLLQLNGDDDNDDVHFF